MASESMDFGVWRSFFVLSHRFVDRLYSAAYAERPRSSPESGILVPARQSVPCGQPPAGTRGTGPHKSPAHRTAQVPSPCVAGRVPPAVRPPHVPPSLLSV